MNNTFNLSRLWLLICKQGAEKIRFYKLALIAMIGLLAFTYLFFMTMMQQKIPDGYNGAIFLIGLYITGTALASTTFQQVHQKETGPYWLTLPASLLEKLLAALFYNSFVFVVLYIACFFLVKTIALQYNHLPDTARVFYSTTIREGMFKGMGMDTDKMYFWYAFFPIQAFFVAGSVWFRKQAFIKTTIAAVVIFFLTLVYMQGLSNRILPQHYNWFGSVVSYYNSAPSMMHKEYTLPAWVFGSIRLMLQYGLILCFWLLAWTRLKEKQL